MFGRKTVVCEAAAAQLGEAAKRYIEREVRKALPDAIRRALHNERVVAQCNGETVDWADRELHQLQAQEIDRLRDEIRELRKFNDALENHMKRWAATDI